MNSSNGVAPWMGKNGMVHPLNGKDTKNNNKEEHNQHQQPTEGIKLKENETTKEACFSEKSQKSNRKLKIQSNAKQHHPLSKSMPSISLHSEEVKSWVDSPRKPLLPDENKHNEAVLRGSEFAASKISQAALWLEKGLGTSASKLNLGIEFAGNFAKDQLPPSNSTLENDPNEGENGDEQKNEEPEENDLPEGISAKTISNAAKVGTDAIRLTAKSAALGLRNASTRGIYAVAQKFQEEELGPQLIPDAESRDFVVAAGKVGLATAGAVAIVAEAMFEATKSVAQKSVSTTADVVRHTHGDDAGQVVQDAGDATGNVLRTMVHVAMLEGGVLAKAVAKEAGKVSIVGMEEANKRNAEENVFVSLWEKVSEGLKDDDPFNGVSGSSVIKNTQANPGISLSKEEL